MRIDEAVRKATTQLSHSGVPDARQDARILLSHLLEDREILYREPERLLSQNEEAQYFDLITRRAEREPVSHLTQCREFYSRLFKVTADVLDPRPDSETLIDVVLKEIPNNDQSFRLLDLGTGSGCLALTILAERAASTAVAVDLSDEALNIAAFNAHALELSHRVEFAKGPWFENVSGIFDVIISNPPYIQTADILTLEPEVRVHEPMLALDGGESGYACYDAILAEIANHAAADTLVVFEIGQGQHEVLQAKMLHVGISDIKFHEDLASVVRCVSGRFKK
jgi:release factor glutamine methyltransferase